MEIFILILIISTITIFLTNIFKTKFEEVIPISVIGITSVIYIFGLFDNLNLGVKVIEILSVLMTIYNIYYMVLSIKQKKIKQDLERWITSGFFVYIGIIMIFIIINTGRIFEDYDEFNHWALIIKNMFIYNQYGTAEKSIVNFNEYPPFTATFQYLPLRLNGKYSEDVILIAQNILYLSLIMPICRKIDFGKKIKNLILIIPIIILLPLVFYDHFYINILVDAFLGIAFAIGLFIIYKDYDNKLYKNIYLSFIILALALTKTTGILLAIILLITEFIKDIKDKKTFKQIIKKIFIISIVPIILTIFWYIKINLGVIEKEWDFTTLVQNNQRNEIEITKTFIKAILGLPWTTERGFTVISIILLIIAFSIYLFNSSKTKKEKKDYLYVSSVLAISTFIFYGGLLWMYLKLFTEAETQVLSSFVRYTSTMLLSGVLFNTLVFLENKELSKIHIYTFLVILISFLPLNIIKEKYLNRTEAINSSIVKRQYYTTITRYKPFLKEDDKVFFLSNTDINNVYIYKMCRYEMMEKYLGNYVCYHVESIEKLKEDLLNGNYTHLYIYRVDDNFKEDYKELFEDNKVSYDKLYKINLNEENGLILSEVKI